MNTLKKRPVIYCIPGVGADETVFNRLTFPEGMEVRHIRWHTPKKGQSLGDYAPELLEQIDPDTDPIYVGLSFGGIVSLELNKLRKARKVFLISSIKTFYERPFRMGILSRFKAHRLLPTALVAETDFWHGWAFGAVNREDKRLITEMIRKVDLYFNQWAVDSAIHWENTERFDNVVHIHGTHDRMFPIYYIRDCIRIEGGSHFMIVNKAKEVSYHINDVLERSVLQEV